MSTEDTEHAASAAERRFSTLRALERHLVDAVRRADATKRLDWELRFGSDTRDR